MAMPGYVERDGDWVWRPPGELAETLMFVHALPVQNVAALQALCDAFISTPSGSAVSATPYSTTRPFVLLVCADIQHGKSSHSVDGAKGFMTEQDVGFFVPVHFTDQAGTSAVAMLLPYLYVSNLPAVVIGREIFGFPKLLGDIQIFEHPPFAEVKAEALPIYSPANPVLVGERIIRLRSTTPVQSNVCVPGGIAQLTLMALTFVLGALGLPVPANGFTSVPMVFLKQFRDVGNSSQACFQSVTRATAQIVSIDQVCLLQGAFEIDLPPYDSIRIAERLGLGPAPHKPLAGVSAKLHFRLPHGVNEWTAP